MSNTTVLITGANQGIGLEIAKKLAREQSNYTILMGSRDHRKGEAAARSIPGFATGTSAHAIQVDVCSDDSISSCVSEIEKKHGRLDVLINNAGIASASVKGQPLRKQLQNILDTNAIGAACLTDACIPLLRKASTPRVVFVSSGLGSLTDTLDPNWKYYGLDGQAYKCSKAAMNMVAATFAVKYAKDRFKINVSDPGHCATNLNNFSAAAGEASEGAVNVCRLATLGEEGETGTFSNMNGPLKW